MSLKENGVVVAAFAAGATAGMILCHLWTPSFCTAPKSKKSYKLIYFDLKGLAEVTRLMFVQTGTSFEEKRYAISPKDNWAKPEFDADSKAGKFSHTCNQVPILEVTENGKTLSFGQSKAIERYVASSLGLAGANESESALVDMICEHIRDVRDQFRKEKDAEKDESKQAESLTKWVDSTLAGWLKEIDAGLSGAPGYAVGSSMTAADIMIFYIFDDFLKGAAPGLEKALSPCTRIEAIRKRVAADPRISSYLKTRPQFPF